MFCRFIAGLGMVEDLRCDMESTALYINFVIFISCFSRHCDVIPLI